MLLETLVGLSLIIFFLHVSVEPSAGLKRPSESKPAAAVVPKWPRNLQEERSARAFCHRWTMWCNSKARISLPECCFLKRLVGVASLRPHSEIRSGGGVSLHDLRSTRTINNINRQGPGVFCQHRQTLCCSKNQPRHACETSPISTT